MANPIVNLYQMHQIMYGKVVRYDTNLIIFAKQVIEYTVGYRAGIYDSNFTYLAEEALLAANPNLDNGTVHNLAMSIKRSTEREIDNRTDFGYYEIRVLCGDLMVEFPQNLFPLDKVTLNYDVPWGSPVGTIKVSHLLDTGNIVPKYIYSDDEEPCDVTMGGKLYIVQEGLWAVVDEELVQMDVPMPTESKNVPTRVTDTYTSKCVGMTTPTHRTEVYDHYLGNDYLVIGNGSQYIKEYQTHVYAISDCEVFINNAWHRINAGHYVYNDTDGEFVTIFPKPDKLEDITTIVQHGYDYTGSSLPTVENNSRDVVMFFCNGRYHCVKRGISTWDVEEAKYLLNK